VSCVYKYRRSLNANPLPRKVDKELYTSPVSRSQRLCELLISSSLEQDQMTGWETHRQTHRQTHRLVHIHVLTA